MKQLFVFIMFLQGIHCFSQPVKLDIIADGKSDYSIVVPVGEDPQRRIAKAADLLQSLLKKASGVTLPIIKEDKLPMEKPAIYLGRTKAALAAGIPLEKLKGWAYLKQVQGKNLFLAGIDRSLGIKGAVRRGYSGTLKAVISFLEEEADFRFLLPGPNGIYIPCLANLSVNTTLKTLVEPNVRYCAPSNNDCWPSLRGDSKTEIYDIANDQFFFGGYGTYCGHSHYSAVPYNRFAESHPEYFAMINGKRAVKGKHLCISNPEVQELMLEEMEHLLDRGYEWVQLAQTDGYKPCECEKCRAIHEDPGERLWIVHRKLAEEMQKRRPGKKIVILSYGPTMLVPRTFKKFPDNVVIELCNYEPWHIQEWKPFASTFVTYIYNWGIYNAVGYGPKLTPRFVSEQARLFVTNGIAGIFKCGFGENMGLEGPTYYVFGRTLQDPSRDPDQLADDFYRHAYGRAYPAMKDFFEKMYASLAYFGDLKERLREEMLNSYIAYGSYWDRKGSNESPRRKYKPELIYPIIFPPELLQTLTERLEQAKKLDSDPMVAARIRLVEREFLYVKNVATIFNYYQDYKQKPDPKLYSLLLDEIEKRNQLINSYFDADGNMILEDNWPSFLGNPWGASRLKDGGRSLGKLRAPFNWDVAACRKIAERMAEKKALKISKLKATPVLKAAEDEKTWESVPACALDEIMGKKVKHPAKFRAAYDEENIYFFVTCEIPKNEKNKKAPRDFVVLLLDPSGKRQKYSRFTLGAGGYQGTCRFGHIGDIYHPLYGKEDHSWKGKAKVSRWIDTANNRWLLEARIPFAGLDTPPPRPGTKWTINVVRKYYLPQEKKGGEVEILSWAPNMSRNFTEPAIFGDLLFE